MELAYEVPPLIKQFFNVWVCYYVHHVVAVFCYQASVEKCAR